MLKSKFSILVRLAPALALLSCMAPKATIVEEAPVPKTEKPQESAAVQEDPAPAGLPNDGIRLPDMLGLPDEVEFRNAGVSTPDKSGSGAVIARPPTEATPPKR